MSIKTFEEGKKFSRRSWRVLLWGFSEHNDNEIQTNCHVEFDVKKNKNNKKLVGSYLRCAYNHVLLEKTSRLYQIRCLTRRKLRIYFKHALFHRLSHSWQAVIGFDQIFGFVSKRSGSLRWSGVSRIHFKQKKSNGLNWSQISLISKSDLNVNEAYSGAQLEKENMKNPSVPRPSLRWLRDQERLERFWRVGSFLAFYNHIALIYTIFSPRTT